MFSHSPPSVNQPLRLQEIEGELEITMKREDQIHPDISGNKWRKLKYNFQHAKQNGYQRYWLSAASNNLAAVASAGHKYGFQTHGIVRGEELETRAPTRQYCT